MGVASLLGAVVGLGASLRADLFDDAFITAVFARHLAHGQGLTWVAGDPPFWGPTSLLQAALLAACSGLGLDLQTASQVLGALGWAAASGLLVLLLQAFGLRVAVVGGVAMAVSPAALQLASGMESALFTMLCLLTLLLYGRSRPTAAGFAAAAATLARPEGVLLFPLLAVAAVVDRPSGRDRWLGAVKAVSPGLAASAIVVAGMAAWVGSPVPQSILAKRAFGCDVSGCFSPYNALQAMASSLGRVQASILIAGAALGAPRLLRDRSSRWLAIWGALLMLAFTLGGAPDSPWYYVSLFPPLYACAAASLAGGFRFQRTLGLLAVATIVAGSGFAMARRIAGDPWGREAHWNGEKRQLAAAILRHMADHQKKEARVLAYEVGYFGWSIPGRVDDLLGLVTPGFQPCLAGQDGDAVLARLQPDYVALVDTPTYAATGCIRTAAALSAGYRVILSLPTAWGNHYEVWARASETSRTSAGATITP